MQTRYGVDGGWPVVGAFSLLATASGAAAIRAVRRRRRPAALLAMLAGGVVVAAAADYLYCTGPGKRSLWSDLLDRLELRGDEAVLDVGCGTGAVLLLAARRVPRGGAVGVDVWRSVDLTGNSPTATEGNALAEGVADRVGVVGADARRLPFSDASFDVVVSNLTLHNIRDAGGRRLALQEMVRVLRPGGRLRIVDHDAQHYAPTLGDAGCKDLGSRRLDRRTSYGVPGHRLTLVEATRA